MIVPFSVDCEGTSHILCIRMWSACWHEIPFNNAACYKLLCSYMLHTTCYMLRVPSLVFSCYMFHVSCYLLRAPCCMLSIYLAPVLLFLLLPPSPSRPSFFLLNYPMLLVLKQCHLKWIPMNVSYH